MTNRWGIAAAALALVVAGSAAQAAPVTIDFSTQRAGDAVASDSAFVTTDSSFRADTSIRVDDASVAPSLGTSADAPQFQFGTSAADSGVLSGSFDVGPAASFDASTGGGAGRISRAGGSVAGGARSDAVNHNFFDAPTVLASAQGDGFTAAGGNVDSGAFGNFNVGISQIVSTPLPQSATMGVGLLAVLGGFGLWRRRRQSGDVA